MVEYIEREALWRAFECEPFYDNADRDEIVLPKIDDFPASDVAPVVHGQWFNLTECANEGVYCSVCHKKVYRADYAWCVKKNKVRSNYCPNCGAKMDLEDK